MTKHLVLVSELAFYPIHWEALQELGRAYDVRTTVVAAEAASLPDVHRRLGWERAPAGVTDVAVHLLPRTSRVRRALWLRRLLRRLDPDALWIQQEPTDGLAIDVLASMRRNRRAVVVGAVCENIFERPPFLRRILLRTLWRRLNALAAVATASIDGVRHAGMPEVIPARPLVAGALAPTRPERTLALQWPPDTFVVGFVGRLVHEKGIETLLAAQAHLPDHFRLLVAGDGPLRSLMQGSAADRIEWVGLVDHDELWRVYATMDCLVVPSLTTPTWKEQFGGVIADGMAAGVPIVGSDSGSIPEVVGDAGLVFAEDSVDGLVTLLLRLAGDADLRTRLAANGRARFEAEFAIPAYARKLADLLELTRRPAPRSDFQPTSQV